MQKKVFVQGLILATVLIVPLIHNYMGHQFYLDFATMLCILAIAAVGLNFILGYGGMISFGHAAYLGLGAYAVGIPAHHWLYGGMDAIATTNGFVQFGLALLVSGIFALLTGLICLKVKGVYFIMITMAFAQMVYYCSSLSLNTAGTMGWSLIRAQNFHWSISMMQRNCSQYAQYRCFS